MALDLIFVLLLALMSGLGVWRGAVASGSGLAAMVCGYLGAMLAATRGAGRVAEALVVPPILAPAIAGTIGFAVAWWVASALADVGMAWDRERVEGGGRGILDRALGGFFGLARGALVVLLLAVLANWVDAARDLGVLDGFAALPDAETSAVGRASGEVVEAVVSTALADAGPAGTVAARLTGRPGQTLGSVQSILDDERMGRMFEDRLFWTLISRGSIDYAMNRTAIRSIVHDPEMRGRFADLGLVDEAARGDADVFREAMAGVLAEVGPKIQRLQNDPELKALANDPEILELLESGNTLALINHPRIRTLVEKLSAEP
ncbi:MAG TPA: CvpA family protein [Deltaproteobacteria bacterium]|nr:CvpA family protein [Deltaproteobacteria bacterium]